VNHAQDARATVKLTLPALDVAPDLPLESWALTGWDRCFGIDHLPNSFLQCRFCAGCCKPDSPKRPDLQTSIQEPGRASAACCKKL